MIRTHYLRQARATDHVLFLPTLPAFPKPHIRPIGGGKWECTRHVFQDEFMSAQGDSAKAAYDACRVWTETDVNRAMSEYARCAANRPMNVSSLRHGLPHA